jgi:pilus assembly protein CpaE
MQPNGAHGTDSERGQASVEFLGTLPAALLVVLVAWQLLLAGQAGWLAGNAVRVGARAEAVGGDARAAARSALPSYLRGHLEVVRDRGEGRLKIRVRVPLLLRRWSSPFAIGASAAMRDQTRGTRVRNQSSR